MHLNSTNPTGYGFIKSIKAQPLISTTARHRGENVLRIEDNMASFDYKRVSTIPSQSIGLRSIPLDISRTTHLVNPLVRESARFFSDLTYSKEITPCFRSCLPFTALYLMRICLFFPLYTLFCATPIAAYESQ